MITIYGIKNCDTMKKTFDWMHEHQIEYAFHNYKTDGISAGKVKEWMKLLPLTEMVNTKGTTYRGLSETEKKSILTQSKAPAIIMENTSVIKRPLIDFGPQLMVGYKPEEWNSILKKTKPLNK